PDSNRSQYPPMAPHGIYKCAGDDQWVSIAVRHDRDWDAMLEAMESPELSNDARFQTLDDRIRNQDELDRLIEEWTARCDPVEVMRVLQDKGVPAAVVQHPAERLDNDPNNLEWGTFPEVEHGEMGRVRVEGLPIRLSETPGRVRLGAPLLGQDNDFAYRELLGLGDEEFEEFMTEGVI
ncbi:MAG: CoA transferase, partial [Chloroflexi bacterium]|nr:CoA transferase [Chloroflexota bacterium]